MKFRPLPSVAVALSVIIAIFMITPSILEAAGPLPSLEITGFSLQPSIEADGRWGWWSPSKYQIWTAPEDDTFELGEIRFSYPGDEYVGFASVEWMPDLVADGTQLDQDGSVVARHALVVEATLYEIGFAEPRELGRKTSIMPWIALTHVQINERVTPIHGADLPVDHAEARLWGGGLGFDIDHRLPWNLSLQAGLSARWVTGDRDSVFSPETDPGVPPAAQVSATDSVDQLIWGTDLGLRWNPSPRFGVETGWRTRDWTADDGPVSFSGPYARLIFSWMKS